MKETMLIYALSRFLIPLVFTAAGVSWSVGGEWTRFIQGQTGAFSSQDITNFVFRGVFLFGSAGMAVGISIEQHLQNQATKTKAESTARVIARLKRLTGSNLPDDTRAAVHLLLEELENEIC